VNKQKSPPAFPRRASFPVSITDYLGQDPSRVGMMMMMAPGDWVDCHKNVW
jgi:hypothetical protein